MSEPISEYTAKINQEIKDNRFTSTDNEYHRLRMREMPYRRLKQKVSVRLAESCLAKELFSSGMNLHAHLSPVKKQLIKARDCIISSAVAHVIM